MKNIIRLLLSIVLASGVSVATTVSADVPRNFKVCFDFNCKNNQWITFSERDWSQVRGLFYLNADAEEERKRIMEAVALMETLVGQYAPTYRDVGRNWSLVSEQLSTQEGQMDCIDESLNTTTYLQLLEGADLLKYHLVRERAYRQSMLIQHWAAQIVDTGSGQYYVVDSWFRDNGEMPYLVKGESWHDLSRF